MLQIEKIQDPETLRQVALILDREVRQLRERLQQLVLEISRLRGQAAGQAQQRLALEMERLQELLTRKQRELLGQVSDPPAVPEAIEPRPGHGHGPRVQARLPVLEQLYELPPSERTCPVCQGTLLEMGNQTEDSEEITVIEPQYVLVKQKRQKYRCRCGRCPDCLGRRAAQARRAQASGCIARCAFFR